MRYIKANGIVIKIDNLRIIQIDAMDNPILTFTFDNEEQCHSSEYESEEEAFKDLENIYKQIMDIVI